MAASQKLAHLLQLADQGPALRAALAEEVADLLSSWPIDYPETMRTACEALLAKAAHDVDAPTRARLRVQLYSCPGLAARILPRESDVNGLIETAREGGDLTKVLSDRLGIDAKTAAQILDDETGQALAVACKAAAIERAAFSALTLLLRPGRDKIHAYAALDAFDAVPTSEATRVLRGWRDAHLPAA